MQDDTLIDFWSYSSMTTLLRNPLAFKKKYILKVYDDLDSPSSIVGKASHKALEAYYNGREIHEAIEVGLDLINNTSDSGIDYGKTGSRANVLSTYNQAINFYFEELPKYHEILGVEQGITAKVKTIDGKELGIPAKSYSDLITRNELGEIEIVDHKFVRSYTDGDVDHFGHFIQAMFNYHTVWAEYGEQPARMIFNECKVSKNRDNTPQIQPYTIEFSSVADFAVFYKLYESCTKLINLPDMVFLPNPNDIFDGQNTFEVFRAGVITVDKPVVVKHKTEQVQFAEKQYIPSAFDKVENENLTDEERIRLKLQEFGVSVSMQETHIGASVIQYTLKPSKGVSMAKIAKLGEDVSIALGAEAVRIQAPIRGTSLVGIEVPSKTRKRIDLTEQHYKRGTLNIPIGVDVYGKVHYKDITEMPHLLIAGATGSGKSVMLNVLLQCLTKQMTPAKLKLVLIDPKRVELSQFADKPHVIGDVIYEADEAVDALVDLTKEMERRYEVLAKAGVRQIADYKGGKLPKIVVVIDEFADLMHSGGKDGKKAIKAEITERDIFGKPVMKYKKEIEAERPSAESLIVRLAQKARAVGIHVVLATQRPSADVVTGLLKANIPTKIAFMTTNKVNSQVILDETGAEELTGKGDMLFMDTGTRGLKRLQGLYF